MPSDDDDDYVRQPRTEITKRESQGPGYLVHRIGDCVQPRLVMEAIREGFTVGRKV